MKKCVDVLMKRGYVDETILLDKISTITTSVHFPIAIGTHQTH